MKRQDLFLCLLFFLIGILTRLPLVEKMQSHMDGPMYSIAVVNYSFEQENPSPPGYPLYIGMGKLFYPITHDPHYSMLLVSVLFSGIGSVLFYLLGKAMGGKPAGVIASLLYLSSPSIYYFGLTPYGYIVVLATTALLALFVYEIMFKGKQLGVPLGVIYALSLGIRPQELLLTLPLFLLGIWYLTNIERLKLAITFLLTILFWFLPFALLTGGIEHYLNVSMLAAKPALPRPSLIYFLHKKFELGSGFFLTLGFSGAVFIVALFDSVKVFLGTRRFSSSSIKFVSFSLAWFLPPLLFNLFIRTEHAGYQFDYLMYFMFYVSYFLSKFYKQHKLIIVCLVGALILSNLVIFFYDRDPSWLKPYRQTSLHYSDIKRNDFELSNKVSYITAHYSPDNTVIFSSTPFWRQYMYHLPLFRVYSVDGLFSSDARYASLVRVGYGWKRDVYELPSRHIMLPKGTKEIIVLDNDSCDWVSSKALKINLGHNTCMSKISVHDSHVVRYRYHTVSLS